MDQKNLKEKEILSKIVTSKDTKHLCGIDDQYECCYSCSHFKSTHAERGICKLRETNINNGQIYKCTDYNEVLLVQCDICGRYLRSLGQHVRTHNITANEYKLIHGYNKGTGLVCNATKQMLHEFGKTQIENLLKHNPVLNEGKCFNKKGYSINDEGRYNISKASRNITDETRDKMSKAHKGKKYKGHIKSEEWRKKLSKAHKQRCKVMKRTIQRDERGRIIAYSEKYIKD